MSGVGQDASDDARETELPTEELRAAALELLEETPELRAKKIDELRDAILAQQPEDRLADLSAPNLIRYLRGKKYNVAKALSLTINYVKFGRENELFVTPLSPRERTDFLRVFSKGVQLLPHRDAGGRIVLLIQPGLFVRDLAQTEFREMHPHSLTRFNVWLFDVLSSNVEIQVYGLTVVNSFKGITLSDSWSTLPTIAPISERTLIFRYIQNACPFRLKNAYIFDEPFYVTWLSSIVFVFLTAKLRARYHICGSSYERIREVLIDDEHVPVCVGGNFQGDGGSWLSAQFARY